MQELQKNFKGGCCKNFSKSIFRRITFAYPQNDETKGYLKKLDTKNIYQIGNLYLSGSSNKNLNQSNNRLKSELKKEKSDCIGTHKNEEIFKAICILN